MLSGWGGDEGIAFNGRGYFADLFRRGRWGTMTRELALRSRLHADDFWGNLKNRAVLPLLPDGLLQHVRPDLLDASPMSLPLELLHPAFIARLSRVPPYPVGNLRERPGARNYQLRLLNHGFLTARLESWSDNGGYRGIEYRYPLLDRRIIEFGLGVPERMFHYQGWKRYLFRKTVDAVLPEAVTWNKSKRESALTRSTLKNEEEARRMLLQFVSEHQIYIRQAGYLQDDALLTRLQNQGKQTTPENEIIRVLWLVQLR
jgi:asparagine synthase (glutamine-hydrolysing)